MGARTDAARAEVLRARDGLDVEIDGLKVATKEAFDIPAKIRRAPARTAALAGGGAFLVLGGPLRILRRFRRIVRGSSADLPPSMLPKEIEKALRGLGTDGTKVQGALEREFARYLEGTKGARAKRNVSDAASEAFAGVIRSAGRRGGAKLVSRLLFDEPGGVAGGGAPGGSGAAGGAIGEQLKKTFAEIREAVTKRD